MSRPPDGFHNGPRSRTASLILWLLLAALIACWALFSWHPWAGGPHA